MTDRIYKSVVLWSMILVLGVVNPLVYMLPTLITFEVLNSLIVAVYAGVLWGYARSGYDVLAVPPPELRTSDLLQLAVVLGSLGAILVFGTLWIWRLSDEAPVYNGSLINHWVGALGRWILVMAGAILLATAGSIEGRVPRRSYMKAGAWLSGGLAVAGIVTTLSLRWD